ncbi:MAG TPA: HAMP domain-containing sensor histidine kinase [Polyangia bacterium]|nr:HAMP domain-containing sensor histidine kinase [Polyangia bacterium]
MDGFESIAEHTELLAAVGRCFLLPDQDSVLEGVARAALPLLGGVCVVDEITPTGPMRLMEFRRDLRTWIAPPARLAGITRTEICTDNHCPRMTVPVSGSRGQIATLTFASRNDVYGCAEIALAEEIGNRLGLALENVRARTTLNQALTDRDRFISIAAHELRAPACALRICVQTLQRDKAPVSEKQARVLNMIERQERRLSSLVDRLLDLALAQSGRLDLHPESIDVCEVVRDVVASLKTADPHEEPEVFLDLPETTAGNWDRSRLEQVVTNLVTNAIKYGGGTPISVRLVNDPVSQCIRLEVADRGPGIPPEVAETIFEPFKRGPTANHRGLGLGLYIVRNIVVSMGGSIHVDTQPGCGATFVVELPLTAK